MRRALLPLIAAWLGAAAPALAAERVAPSSGPERIAFGVILVGTIIFFGWVAWLALRR
jgi:hypothetical protein